MIKYKSCSSGHVLWFDYKDTTSTTSYSLKRWCIEEIKDYVETTNEISFIVSLHECLKELKKKGSGSTREYIKAQK